MPVIIHKRSKPPEQPPVEAPPARSEPVEATALPPGVPERPKIVKTIHVGKADILPDLDVHDVPGRTKFLVHIHKYENGKPIWYRIIGYDENTHQMKLRSRHKNTFEAKLHPTVALHYMVVMQEEGTTEPLPAAVSEIIKMMTVEPIKVLPGSFVGHASPAAKAAAAEAMQHQDEKKVDDPKPKPSPVKKKPAAKK